MLQGARQSLPKALGWQGARRGALRAVGLLHPPPHPSCGFVTPTQLLSAPPPPARTHNHLPHLPPHTPHTPTRPRSGCLSSSRRRASRRPAAPLFDSQCQHLFTQLNSPNTSPPNAQLLSEQLAEARELSSRWEAQAQDALSTISRLQDCLEEGAAWDAENAPPAGADGGGGGGDVDAAGDKAGGGGGGGSAAAAGAARAALELRSRALAAELLRAHAARGALSRALVPLLSGVEARLMAAREAAARAR